MYGVGLELDDAHLLGIGEELTDDNSVVRQDAARLAAARQAWGERLHAPSHRRYISALCLAADARWQMHGHMRIHALQHRTGPCRVTSLFSGRKRSSLVPCLPQSSRSLEDASPSYMPNDIRRERRLLDFSIGT